MSKYTHDELTNRAVRWLENTIRCQLVLKEARGTWEQPDAIGFKGNASYLIEVKASRSDFKRDKLKIQRHARMSSYGLGLYRYYLCEPGIITIPDLPPKWGLLYVKPKIISKVREAEGFDRSIERLLREVRLLVHEFSNYQKRGFTKSRRTW